MPVGSDRRPTGRQTQALLGTVDDLSRRDLRSMPSSGPLLDSGRVILLDDPRVRAVPVAECGDPLVRLGPQLGPAHALVREGLAARLVRAQAALPPGVHLQVVEGHRPLARQRAIIAAYATEVALAHPGCSEDEQRRLVSRFVSPVAVAPHVAGAAVDVTLAEVLADGSRVELDLGTAIDATPEESGGRCFTGSTGFGVQARRRRDLLCRALGGAGLVNYPTEWWHWSYGDRYWALLTGAPSALYGPSEGSLGADLVVAGDAR